MKGGLTINIEMVLIWLRRSKMLENIEEAFDTAQSYSYSLTLEIVL